MTVNDTINKMLGTKKTSCDNSFGKNVGTKGFGQGMKRGNGAGPLNTGLSKMKGMNIGAGNNSDVTSQIKNLMHRIPDVKAAKGTITLKFKNGSSSTINIQYQE